MADAKRLVITMAEDLKAGEPGRWCAGDPSCVEVVVASVRLQGPEMGPAQEFCAEHLGQLVLGFVGVES